MADFILAAPSAMGIVVVAHISLLTIIALNPRGSCGDIAAAAAAAAALLRLEFPLGAEYCEPAHGCVENSGLACWWDCVLHFGIISGVETEGLAQG